MMTKNIGKTRPSPLQPPNTPPTPKSSRIYTTTTNTTTNMTLPPKITITTPTTPTLTPTAITDATSDQALYHQLPPPLFTLPQPTYDYFTSIVSCDTWVECTHILLHEVTAIRYQRDIVLGSYNPHYNPPFYNYQALYGGLGMNGEAWRWNDNGAGYGTGYGFGVELDDRPVSPCTTSYPVFGFAPGIEMNEALVSAPSPSPAHTERKALPEVKNKAGLAARAKGKATEKAKQLPTLYEQGDHDHPVQTATTAHFRSKSTPTPTPGFTVTPEPMPEYIFDTRTLPHPFQTTITPLYPTATLPTDWETSFAQYMLDYHAHMHAIASTRGCSLADAWEVMETERWAWRVEVAQVRGVMEPNLDFGLGSEREKWRGKWERRGAVDLS